MSTLRCLGDRHVVLFANFSCEGVLRPLVAARTCEKGKVFYACSLDQQNHRGGAMQRVLAQPT